MRNVQFIDTKCTENVAAQIIRIYSCMNDAVTVDETRIQFIVHIEIESIKQQLDERETRDANGQLSIRMKRQWQHSSRTLLCSNAVRSWYTCIVLYYAVDTCVCVPKNVDAQFH